MYSGLKKRKISFILYSDKRSFLEKVKDLLQEAYSDLINLMKGINYHFSKFLLKKIPVIFKVKIEEETLIKE